MIKIKLKCAGVEAVACRGNGWENELKIKYKFAGEGSEP